jgi:hypothetical protein
MFLIFLQLLSQLFQQQELQFSVALLQLVAELQFQLHLLLCQNPIRKSFD